MRTHPLNPDIALPEKLRDVKAANVNGILCLKDEFDKTYAGAIFRSPVLEALALRFNYESLGYDLLKADEEYYERMVLVEYKKGRVGEFRQSTVNDDTGGGFEVTQLDDDLESFVPVWNKLFGKFGGEVSAIVGGNFELRLKCLTRSKHYFHKDPKSIIGILALGKGREPTICAAADGGMIQPDIGSFVMTTPELSHSSPISYHPRMGLAVTKYERYFT